MKKFKYEFEVADNFEIGDCFNCPFNHTEWYDDDGWNDCYDYCIIGGNCEDKLKEVKDESYLQQVKNLTDEEIKELKEILELLNQAMTLKEMHDRI